MKNILKLAAALALAAAGPVLAQTTLVSDNFEAATTGTAGASGLGYYSVINSGTLSVIDPGISNKSLETRHNINAGDGNGPIKSFVASGSNITLGATGDSLTLQFSVRASTDWRNTINDYFRFGLLNYTGTTGGSPVAVNSTLGNTGHEYTGYFGAIGTSTSGSASGIVQCEATNAGVTNRIFYTGTGGVVNTELLNIANTTITPLGSTNDTTVYTMSLALERVATGLQITLGKDAESTSIIDTASPYYSFNSFAIAVERRGGTGSLENTFWIDDVTVTQLVVPEPTALALALGGIGMTMLLRRRGRRPARF